MPVSEPPEPMDETLKRFAELYVDKRLELDKIAEELGLEKKTAKVYATKVKRYIEFAAQKLKELRERGVSFEEAIEKLKQEYNLTDGVIKEAMRVVGEELLKQQLEPKAGEQRAGQEAKQEAQAPEQLPKELKKLAKEGEEARKRVLGELKAVSEESGEGEELPEAVKELIKARKTLEMAARVAQIPGVTTPTTTAQASQSIPKEIAEAIIAISKAIEQLNKRISQLEASQYRGFVKRVTTPDGHVIEYDYLPDDKIKLIYYVTKAKTMRKQTDAIAENIPTIIDKVDKRLDRLEALGERLLAIVENYFVPKISRLHPALESILPITVRTPEQREKELEEIEKRVEVKEVKTVAGAGGEKK